MRGEKGIFLNFECLLVTPFHSTEKKYKNLLKCAPYIPGSTIRGNLLSNMIVKHCTDNKLAELASLKKETEIIEYHFRCEELTCPVKKLIKGGKWAIITSFGLFSNLSYASITRIALTRDTKTSSSGNIFNLEQINVGCKFSFYITFPEGTDNLIGHIISSVEEIGMDFGIGRYKNIGLGRYQIEDVQTKRIKDVVQEEIEKINITGNRFRLEFITPFVLHYNDCIIDFNSNQFAALFSNILVNRSKELSDLYDLDLLINPLLISSINAYINPDYINRYSLEESSKKNRLIAKSSSIFDLYLDKEDAYLPNQLALCSLFGIGEWADMGFGRFSIG